MRESESRSVVKILGGTDVKIQFQKPVNEKQKYSSKKLLVAFSILIAVVVSVAGGQPAHAAYLFINRTTANGLGGNSVNGVFADDDAIYAATIGGLSISTDGGNAFINKTTSDGLGANSVLGVYVSGGTVYAATGNGLSISNDGGNSFTNKTIDDGLGGYTVYRVFANGGTIYAATDGGLSISTDGGSTFTNKTVADGLGEGEVGCVFADGSLVYAGTGGGLSISTDGGNTFTNKTTANGLGGNLVFGVFVMGNTVYAATEGGLSISTDGGNTFTNKTTDDGLGSNIVGGVYAIGNTVYAATEHGLSISNDSGGIFVNYTAADGLGDNAVYNVFATSSIVYAATFGGLSIAATGINEIVVINTNDTGPGSLRQALADSSDGDTIRFDSALAGQTIYLASELEVNKSVTINGMDLTSHIRISGDTDNNGTGDVQLMTITSLSTVSIYGIDFVSGKNSPGTNSGGINNLGSLAIYSSAFLDNMGDQGGAIRNSGILTVDDTIFNNNSALEGGAILNNPNTQAEIRNSAFNWNSADAGEGGAGAIANLGTISIFDCSFIENTAHNGGAIVNSFGGTMTISASIFTGNSASGLGGAAYNFEGTTTITQSTFSANNAYSGGAIGIGKFGEQYPATTNISESIIINNQASYSAGGVLFESGTSISLDKVSMSGNSAPIVGGILNASYKPLLITNSAIFNNIASLSPYPGGILTLSSPLTIRNSTITGNSGTGVGAQGETVISNSTIAGNTGNGLDFFDFTLTITNTILANNGGLDCQNQYGTVVVNENNLIETNLNCGVPMLTSDPNLGPLANNSGITQTLALLPGSPAINAGNDATCETTDQRGVARPEGPHCDIGAYEYHYAEIYYVKPLATGTGDCLSWDNACTLENALITAIGGDEIWVTAGTHKPAIGTDRHATFQLKEGVAIYGGFAGTETARDQRDPLVNIVILSGDLNGDDIGFTNNDENVYHVVTGANNATLDGFTIVAGNAANVDVGPSCGGGMYNEYSNPTLTNIIFRGNWARCGGGMYNDRQSNPMLVNISFNGNSAMWGGGMYNDRQSNPILVNVTFNGNSATESGGGMYNYGSNPALTNVTFSVNSAVYAGGGMENHFSSPALTNGTFNNNSAGFYGGGMGNEYGSNTQIRNTIFWENTAPTGTQIYNSGSTLSVSDSVVQGGCSAGSICTRIISTNPMLGSLGNYGGFTQTIPLLPGSSAIDTGNDAICQAAVGAPDFGAGGLDQRGVTRPQGTHCDIGAFEVDQLPPTDIQIDYTSVAENQPIGTIVGTLTTTDPDAGDTHTYSFCGGADDTSFQISGSDLQTNAVFDFETKNSYNICIRTDDGHGGTFDKVFTITATNVIETLTATFHSVGTNDGWVLESTETSNMGGTMNSTATVFNLGDNAADKQYRAILHFNTSSLPDTAVITKATLKIRKQGLAGADPFATLGKILVDIRTGAFSNNNALQLTDFQVAAHKNIAGVIWNTPVNYWYSVVFPSSAFPYLNETGVTQFRLRFQIGDNDNATADYLKFFSGDHPTASVRPTLIVEYYVP